ncbi:MAG: hypothetical protein J6S69_04230 [Proteobacteria bacterium]|jgi:hypothetical protein|nr:hypothetical protein [Pseudomonadota bacterium]
MSKESSHQPSVLQDDTTDTELESLFEMLPEGTRIVIRGNTVTFENMTPDLLDVALSLNPNDSDLLARRNQS